MTDKHIGWICADFECVSEQAGPTIVIVTGLDRLSEKITERLELPVDGTPVHTSDAMWPPMLIEKITNC